MADLRKTLSEREILATLAEGLVSFPPLEVEEIQTDPYHGTEERGVDALLSLRWRGKTYRFAVECKSLSNPKAIDSAAYQALRASEALNLNPLLLVPYLPEQRLLMLEERSISGLDLCGNGVITIPGELLVFRTGAPNKFPREGTIKNIYRRNSAIAARVFLLIPQYSSLQEVKEEIARRGGNLTMATVSKVCSSLDNELVIESRRDTKTSWRRSRLLQPDKLLDLLVTNYEPPTVKGRFIGKSRLSPEETIERLIAWQQTSRQRAVLTGSSSTEYYAAMAREKKQAFYCTDIFGVLEAIGPELQETTRFANVELIETEDQFVYFDTRDRLAASPIQTYLELMRGDKREQDTAEQVRRMILVGIRKCRSGDELA